MKILIVGHGGRESALLWKLRRDHPEATFLMTGGNGGTTGLARVIEADGEDVDAIVAAVLSENVDFTVVGPETPLAAGVVDALRERGASVFGPTAAGARLESSKAWAKQVMFAAGVSTAASETFRDRAVAADYAGRAGVPIVVKASGLAAGKGAIVCHTPEDVDRALDACFVERAFGTAGDEVVIEAFLEGEEISVIALTDGRNLVPLIASQDHKAAHDGDHGPNTGGMGAYAPVSIIDRPTIDDLVETIFRPLLQVMADEGIRFTGCLYAGLMLTTDGPQVLEWNVRFGDPEAEALFPLLEHDLLDLLRRTETPDGLRGVEPRWRAGAAMTVVVAARGYPGAYAREVPVTIPADLADPACFDRDGVVIFHAGTRRDGGSIVSSGGRVLAVTAVGSDLLEARNRAYDAVERIAGEDLWYRTDIGWRELARTAR